VDFSGLIFVALAVLWLGYLVPLMLHRKDTSVYAEAEPGEPFTPTVTIVRRGRPLDTAEDGAAVVSTPLNRRAALGELRLIDERAAIRRRFVLAVLLVAVAAVGALVALHRLQWWSIGVPVGLVVAFLAVARVTVKRMRADLDAKAAHIRTSHDVAEETIPIKVIQPAEASHESTIDLTAPIPVTASLWEPIPITVPTYVSKPLAPRTVRTIDLSAPVGSSVGGIPVTADTPESLDDALGLDGRRAVNE
jgi:hypothetical protein